MKLRHPRLQQQNDVELQHSLLPATTLPGAAGAVARHSSSNDDIIVVDIGSSNNNKSITNINDDRDDKKRKHYYHHSFWSTSSSKLARVCLLALLGILVPGMMLYVGTTTSSSSSSGICVDTPNYRFEGHEDKDCENWAPQQRILKCKRLDKHTGHKIAVHCPSVCHEACRANTSSGGGGVDKTIRTAGDGSTYPHTGEPVTVHYTGTLTSDGTQFDSSVTRGTPFQFTLGVGQVIQGM